MVEEVTGLGILFSINGRLGPQFEEKPVKVGIHKTGYQTMIIWSYSYVDLGAVLRDFREEDLGKKLKVGLRRKVPASHYDLNYLRRRNLTENKFLVRVDEYNSKSNKGESGMPGYERQGAVFVDENYIIDLIRDCERRFLNGDRNKPSVGYFVRTPHLNFSFPMKVIWDCRDKSTLGYNASLDHLDALEPQVSSEIGMSLSQPAFEFVYPDTTIDQRHSSYCPGGMKERLLHLGKSQVRTSEVRDLIVLNYDSLIKLEERLRK